MAKYFKQRLTGEAGFGVSPPIEPLNGLQPMRRSPVEAIFRAQDRVVTMGRRVVAEGGLRGSETFFTPDSDPTSMVGTHPAPTDRRLIAGGSIDLTPGSFFRASVVSVPSGETQLTGTTTAGGASGSIDIDIVWTDQDTGSVSTSHTIPLQSSGEVHGAEPDNMFSQLRQVLTDYLTPGGVTDPVELRRWSRRANARVLVYAVGGARPVDVCVWEEPYATAMEADDDGEEFCSHFYADGTPGGTRSPLLYPWQRASETTPDGNPRAGTLHAMDVHHGQQRYLGPVLFSWCGARESDGSEGVSITSNSLVSVLGSGQTTFDITEPGLPVGTGGYARRLSSNGPYVLRDRVAAIPVFIRVYATVSAATGTIRVMTREDSYIDMTIPVGGPSWHLAYGWLEVGINPDDIASTLAQLFAMVGVGGTFTVHVVTLHYAGGYSPAA